MCVVNCDESTTQGVWRVFRAVYWRYRAVHCRKSRLCVTRKNIKLELFSELLTESNQLFLDVLNNILNLFVKHAEPTLVYGSFAKDLVLEIIFYNKKNYTFHVYRDDVNRKMLL